MSETRSLGGRNRRHVVVIGGGVGGLSVAARLAADGMDVEVLEQADTVGGKLGLIEVEGFRFDTGPSLVTLPQILDDTLRATGAGVEEALSLRRLDPIARYRFGDGTWLDADADDAVFAARLEREIHPGAGVQWSALMDRAAAMWEASAERVLTRPLSSVGDLLRMAGDPRNVATIAPHRTLRSIAHEHLSDPRLRVLVDRYATYSGSDPRKVPAALLTVPFAERHFGGWYVDGGLRTIADVLAARVEAHGGRITTGARVADILVADGRASGVVLQDGRRVPADLVVANAEAARVMGMLPADQRGFLRRRLRLADRSFAGWVMLLGVRADADGSPHSALAHHTVLFPGRYDDEFDALFARPGRYVEDPTIYVSAPVDPATAPRGHHAVFVLVNAPRSDQVQHPPSGYGDRILQLMADRGVDVRDRIVLRQERSPADLRNATLAMGGAIYGTSSNGPMAAFLRPPNVTPVPGLYLVGGSAHPGGGLPLVMLSARIVAEAITGRRGPRLWP